MEIVAALVVLAGAAGGPAHAAQQLAAPPASAAATASCGARAAEAAKTADVERVVSGRSTLAGCIADGSGIAHLFVEWRSESGRVERICVNPAVRANLWRCEWDTRQLEPGPYQVELVAVDAAGNRGSSHQAYRVVAGPDAAPEQDAEPEPPVPPQAAPDPDEEAGGDAAPAPEQEETPDAAPGDPAIPPSPDASAGGSAQALPGAPKAAVPAPTALLERIVGERLAECERLELAPGVRPDRALSIAVLDCMRPALDAAGAAELSLDEIPVPPAIVIELEDAQAVAAARAILPERVAGVELRPVVAARGASPGELS